MKRLPRGFGRAKRCQEAFGATTLGRVRTFGRHPFMPSKHCQKGYCRALRLIFDGGSGDTGQKSLSIRAVFEIF